MEIASPLRRSHKTSPKRDPNRPPPPPHHPRRPRFRRPAPKPPPQGRAARAAACAEPLAEPMPIPEINPETPRTCHAGTAEDHPPGQSPFTPPPIVRPAQPPGGRRTDAQTVPDTHASQADAPCRTPWPLPPSAAHPLPARRSVDHPPRAPPAVHSASRPPHPPHDQTATGPTVNVPGALSPTPVPSPWRFSTHWHGRRTGPHAEKFEEIIKKHNFKFPCISAVESSYPMDAPLNYDDFLAKCTDAQVSIAIVLGPPPESPIQETVFSTNFRKRWIETRSPLSKWCPGTSSEEGLPVLNLALDITLLRIKQRNLTRQLVRPSNLLKSGFRLPWWYPSGLGKSAKLLFAVQIRPAPPIRRDLLR